MGPPSIWCKRSSAASMRDRWQQLSRSVLSTLLASGTGMLAAVVVCLLAGAICVPGAERLVSLRLRADDKLDGSVLSHLKELRSLVLDLPNDYSSHTIV